LPWREIRNPYYIWLSEIILQQTRVNQGLSYYLRFIEQFPEVKDLALAEEEEVLKLWQGLGYYSRARNIHTAAKTIVNSYNGVFPKKHEEILKLKGIGEYTAAAIASFAYNEPYAVVDGNVFRVLSRVFGISTPIDSAAGKKEFLNLATELLNKKEPGLHNQAIMEFGALQCNPAQPECDRCPLKHLCVAYQTQSTQLFPVKEKKTKQRNRYFNYLYIECNGNTFLQKRTKKDVWQNLYEFPLIETKEPINIAELTESVEFNNIFKDIDDIEISNNTVYIKHILSHQIIHTNFYTIKIKQLNNYLNKLGTIEINQLHERPVSRLTELFLQQKQ
jgi:A/G-specific adenine glycosylase